MGDAVPPRGCWTRLDSKLDPIRVSECGVGMAVHRGSIVTAMWRLASTLLLLLAMGCSGPQRLLRDPGCLEGPPPHVGMAYGDEQIALMQREWERAKHASPYVRARTLEKLRHLSPDLSDRFPAPRCDDDLVRRNAQAIAARPLPFTRLLVAQLRTTYGVNEVLDLIDLPETSITPYALASEEAGPPPSRRLVHYLAPLHAPDPMNYAESNRRLREHVGRTSDPLDLLILHGIATGIMDERPVGKGERMRPEARAVVSSWLEDIPRRIHGAPDPVGLELCLRRIFDLGRLAVRIGLETGELHALLDPIIAQRGEVPLTRGIDQGAHDLAEVAREALYDVQELPPDHSHYYEPPPPRRKRFSVREYLDGNEPANGRPTVEAMQRRVGDLDSELQTLRMNQARCWVLDEIARWSPPGEGPRRFDALIAPVFDGDRVRFSTETMCRVTSSLELEDVDDQRRAKLVLHLLAAPPQRIDPRDYSADGRGVFGIEEDEVRSVAAGALAGRLELVDRDPALRSWLTAEAQRQVPGREAIHSTAILQRAFERALAVSDRETARAVLRAWMASIRTVEAAIKAKTITNIYPLEILRDRIRALGDFGKRADLVPEIEAFLRERKNERGAVVAAYLLTL